MTHSQPREGDSGHSPAPVIVLWGNLKATLRNVFLPASLRPHIIIHKRRHVGMRQRGQKRRIAVYLSPRRLAFEMGFSRRSSRSHNLPSKSNTIHLSATLVFPEPVLSWMITWRTGNREKCTILLGPCYFPGEAAVKPVLLHTAKNAADRCGLLSSPC
jgi:hypothetical protein